MKKCINVKSIFSTTETDMKKYLFFRYKNKMNIFLFILYAFIGLVITSCENEINDDTSIQSIPAKSLISDSFRGTNASDNYTWLVGNFSGSQFDDLVRRHKGGVFNRVLESDGEGNLNSVGIVDNYVGSSGDGNYTWLVGNFAGNDYDDLMRRNKIGTYNKLFISKGDGTFNIKGANVIGNDVGITGEEYEWLVGNFAGSKYDDLVRRSKDGKSNIIFISNGDGTFLKKETGENYVGVSGDGNYTWLVGNFAGNDYDDLVRRNKIGTYNKLFISKGDGTFNIKGVNVVGNEEGVTGDEYEWLVGNFAGSKYDDLIRRSKDGKSNTIFISNGDGTFEQMDMNDTLVGVSGVNGYTWLVGDFNGDGYDDLIRRHRDGYAIQDGELKVYNKILLSRGDGTFAVFGMDSKNSFTSGSSTPDTWLVGDFYNNGTGDGGENKYELVKRTETGTDNEIMRPEIFYNMRSLFKGGETVNAYDYNTKSTVSVKYHSYRIPSIVSTEDRIYVFCEARKWDDYDYTATDLVYRMSRDGGHTWSRITILFKYSNSIFHDENDKYDEYPYGTVGNPTAIVDSSNNIHLMFMYTPGRYGSAYGQESNNSEIDPVYDYYKKERFPSDRVSRRIFYSIFNNVNKKWQDPVRLTSLEKMGWDAVGPGTGIEVQYGDDKGVLVFPAMGRNIIVKPEIPKLANEWTWKTQILPPGTDESTIVEADINFPYQYIRNDRSRKNQEINDRRKIFTFQNLDFVENWKDWGRNWEIKIGEQGDELSQTMCQSSLLRYSFNTSEWNPLSVIYFIGPTGHNKRNPMTIKMSTDEHQTWTLMRTLDFEKGGYSSMARHKHPLIQKPLIIVAQESNNSNDRASSTCLSRGTCAQTEAPQCEVSDNENCNKLFALRNIKFRIFSTQWVNEGDPI